MPLGVETGSGSDTPRSAYFPQLESGERSRSRSMNPSVSLFTCLSAQWPAGSPGGWFILPDSLAYMTVQKSQEKKCKEVM